MVTMPMVARCSALVLTLLHVGCAAIVEFPEDPQLVVEGPWRCLTEPVESALPAAPTAHLSLPLCDTLRGCSLPLSGFSAKLCAKLDAGCTNPVSTDISYQNGVFDFDVPTEGAGFDGYLEVSAPNELCTNRDVFGDASASLCALVPACDIASPDTRCSIPTYAPSLLFFNPPIVADAQLAPLAIASTAASRAIALAAGTAVDPTKGNLLVTAVDCDGNRAPGVAFAIGEQQDGVSRLFYLESGILSDARHETDATGTGVFSSVPPGYVDLVGDTAGMRIGGVGAYVSASSNSYTTLVPSF
jgi:hypothetical protein